MAMCDTCGREHTGKCPVEIVPPSNPYLKRLEEAGKNPHGKRSERKVAKKMGARLHPNSGAMTGAKSDASLKEFRLEMKSTVNQTIPIEMVWLVKIAQEALNHGQRPAVVLSFVDSQGVPRMKQYAEWVMLPLAVFLEVTEEN